MCLDKSPKIFFFEVLRISKTDAQRLNLCKHRRSFNFVVGSLQKIERKFTVYNRGFIYTKIIIWMPAGPFSYGGYGLIFPMGNEVLLTIETKLTQHTKPTKNQIKIPAVILSPEMCLAEKYYCPPKNNI